MNPHPTPRVSIIIPTFNNAPFIREAVRSVLSQTFENFELLILDDASTDDTREAIKPLLNDPRIRFVSHANNIGITANRNYGLSIAQGEYIAMLDSDDLWLDAHKLAKQVEILDSHPDIGLVGTYAKKIDRYGAVIDELKASTEDESIRRNMLLRWNQFTQSSVIIRKRALDVVGRYDEKIPVWEDYELWLRIGEKFHFRNIPEFLTAYRDHGGNISKKDERRNLRAHQIIYKLYRKKYPFAWVLLIKIVGKKFLLTLHLEHLSQFFLRNLFKRGF